jgi:hypothetical protein
MPGARQTFAVPPETTLLSECYVISRAFLVEILISRAFLIE